MDFGKLIIYRVARLKAEARLMRDEAVLGTGTCEVTLVGTCALRESGLVCVVAAWQCTGPMRETSAAWDTAEFIERSNFAGTQAFSGWGTLKQALTP